jgi:TonB family protein
MHPVAAQSAFVRRPLGLKRPLLGSLFGHALIIMLAVAWSYLRGPPAIDLNQKPIKASLVRLGKKRDEQLLPRKEEPPPPPPKVEGAVQPPVPAPAPAKPEPAAVAVPGVKPTAKAQPKAQEGDADRRKKLFGAFDKTAKPTKAEDLEGAEDGDPDGDSATAEGDRYWGILSTQVKRHYDVSETIPDSERIRLKAIVRLFVGRTGEVTKVELARSSGNALFDSAVVLAVRKASPFSPPPENLRATLQRSGVVMEFTP